VERIKTLVNNDYQSRIQSIDLLRGMVIILMALDHTRDFWGPTLFNPLSLTETSVPLFFTRWITHFCAPVFLFLTGVSAYLYGTKVTRGVLTNFLIKRGLWLIFLEVVVITFFWKFNFDNSIITQVVWALGWSMIVLSALIWLPRSLILAFSLIIIFGHNYFDFYTPAVDSLWGMIWHFLHIKQEVHIGGALVKIYYPLLPWVAVMALGYCLGSWFHLSAAVRSKRFFWLGIACLAFFILMRTFNLYGDPTPWEVQSRGAIYTFLSFINVTKYPPSLFYLLLTLGIVFTLWPLLEKWRGWTSSVVLTFGKVPMFFYLIHLPIIHLSAVLYWAFLGITPPLHAGYSLSLVYVAWIGVLIFSYPLCAAYKKYKSTHNYAWLHYI